MLLIFTFKKARQGNEYLSDSGSLFQSFGPALDMQCDFKDVRI